MLTFLFNSLFAQVPSVPLASAGTELLQSAELKSVIPTTRAYLQRLKTKGDWGYLRLVRTQSPAQVQSLDQDGIFSLSLALPGLAKEVRIRTIDVKATNDQDYLWRGKVPNDPTSQIVLRSRGDTLFGTIRFANQTYLLEGLEPGVSILMGDRKSPVGKSYAGLKECPLTESYLNSNFSGDQSLEKQPPSGLDKSGTCSGTVFRILVLYTSAAQQTGNMSQLAQASVDQLNDMLDESGLGYTLQAELVGVEFFSQFTESNLLNADLVGITSGNPIQTAFINNRLGVNGADLAIVFTDETYGTTIGQAQGFGPPNRVAIVTAPNATYEMLFAHEVGHLLGGRHEEPTAWAGYPLADVASFIADLNPDGTPGLNHAHIYFNFNTSPVKDKAKVTGMFSIASHDGPGMRQLGWDVDYFPVFSNTTNETISEVWETAQLPAGLYFIQVLDAGRSLTQKIVLTR